MDSEGPYCLSHHVDISTPRSLLCADETFIRNGPSEFYITGPLKDWTVTADAHKITVPTLVTNGKYDEAQDSVVAPFVQEIPNVKWVKFSESSHMSHFEEREKYMAEVGKFLVEG